jgi:hypothetical protein
MVTTIWIVQATYRGRLVVLLYRIWVPSGRLYRFLEVHPPLGLVTRLTNWFWATNLFFGLVQEVVDVLFLSAVEIVRFGNLR